ncbi:hypothetical protein D8770_01105 [Methylobacterium sp. DB1607]|nr:hypothetical protein [Methylobacterium sp. DB1607]
MSARPTPSEADIMRLVRAGLTYVEVGLRLLVSPQRVSRIARSHGYDASKRIKLKAKKRAEIQKRQRAQRALQQAQAAAERKRQQGERGPIRRIPRVPGWAKTAGLAQDYRDLTREFDEDHAARECRKLTAEIRRQKAAEARHGGAA